MGRATHLKSEQIITMKTRINLIHAMIDSLDERSADPEALTHLLGMLDSFSIRIRRYREDWENHLTDK
ncbi:MAG: hypothetical protein ABF586_07295 [Sporolactobacillus sp.]